MSKENLIAQVFDKSVEALGLMTNKLAKTIESSKLSKRTQLAAMAMQGLLSNPSPNLMTTDHEDIVKLSYIFADEILKQEKL